jgi:hypothetical protein
LKLKKSALRTLKAACPVKRIKEFTTSESAHRIRKRRYSPTESSSMYAKPVVSRLTWRTKEKDFYRPCRSFGRVFLFVFLIPFLGTKKGTNLGALKSPFLDWIFPNLICYNITSKGG